MQNISGDRVAGVSLHSVSGSVLFTWLLMLQLSIVSVVLERNVSFVAYVRAYRGERLEAATLWSLLPVAVRHDSQENR